MEEEKFVIHCFGTKISPKSYADLLLQTDIKIARLINEPYYTIDQQPIFSYVEFINQTLRHGKEGDIQGGSDKSGTLSKLHCRIKKLVKN
jgi:hypothetical protein